MNKRILLLYGGASSEHEVSLMGYEYVKELLQNTEHEILPVFISREGEWRLGDENGGVARLTYGGLSTEYGLIKIDGALPLLHGEGGEDGTVQGALKTAGIRFFGHFIFTDGAYFLLQMQDESLIKTFKEIR